MNNNKVGKTGESLAVGYILSKGYGIIARNYKLGYKEIDIIAKDSDFLVFIEVKTRQKQGRGDAISQFSKNKYFNLKQALNTYIISYGYCGKRARIDYIAIDLSLGDNQAKIKHFIDVML